MTPFRRFAIHQPGNVGEASEMLAHYGEQGRLYAGGTELLLAMRHDLLRYEHLIDIKTVPGLAAIEVADSHVRIGAAATHRSIERSEALRDRLPVMAEMARNIANVRVRATGTLGGNLCFAEPHSDPATLLLALGGTAHVTGRSGDRALPLDSLIVGAYETALAADEILVSLEVPVSHAAQRSSYVKFQVHERPLLGLALRLDLDESGSEITGASCAVGSISPRPCRSEEAEALLKGSVQRVQGQLVEASRLLAERAEPVDDLEGSAEYKRHLVGVFLHRAFAQCVRVGN